MDQRVRKDILELTKAEKDLLIRAWRGIQTTPQGAKNDPFFDIASLHGQPFRGAGYANSEWWGGYCHHGNVLFPTWHRAYLLRLEDTLRKVPGCESVTLPYWNEMRSEGERVIPEIFTSKTYKLDNVEIPNPLYSYKFAKGFVDRLSPPNVDYSKPKGYETVRYPFSGLSGPNDKKRADIHNEWCRKFSEEQITGFLNDNVKKWLVGTTEIASQRHKYIECLKAPNYTVFSNTTSATKWNDDNGGTGGLAVPLESPHNGIHLAVGGYDMPDMPSFDGANGDMGENDTAAFDPIFYFHHCFIDKVFWVWQKQSDKPVEIEKDYPGTSPVDLQGPTPGIAPESSLSLDTVLHPFGRTSRDLIDISTLSYKYDGDEIEPPHGPYTEPEDGATSYLRVSGIDRASISGSFIISAWAKGLDGRETLVGYEPVLSRWHVRGCANCNNHLKVTAYIPLRGFSRDFLGNVNFESRIGTSEPRGRLELIGDENMIQISGSTAGEGPTSYSLLYNTLAAHAYRLRRWIFPPTIPSRGELGS